MHEFVLRHVQCDVNKIATNVKFRRNLFVISLSPEDTARCYSYARGKTMLERKEDTFLTPLLL